MNCSNNENQPKVSQQFQSTMISRQPTPTLNALDIRILKQPKGWLADKHIALTNYVLKQDHQIQTDFRILYYNEMSCEMFQYHSVSRFLM